MPQAKSITKRIQAQRTPLIIERNYPNSKLLIEDPDFRGTSNVRKLTLISEDVYRN